MLTLLFAILAVIGSWFAWRRNPMYSARRTLALLLATALSAGAAIAVFAAVIELTRNQSKEVQLAAILCAVFVCAIGLIWILVSVTSPKIAPVPEGTRIATLHRRRLIPWIRRALWTLAVCGALALVPGPQGGFNWVQFIGLFFGAWVLGLGGILLAAGYIGARNLDRALTAVEAHPWIHWSYDAAEWASWAGIQARRCEQERTPESPRKSLRAMLLTCAAIIGSCLFVTGLALWLRAAIGLGIDLLLIGGMFLAGEQQKTSAVRLRRKLAAAQPEAFLAPDGLYANGEYNPWLSTGLFLIEASLDERAPRSLLFRFEKVQAGSGVAAVSVSAQAVLIPAGIDPAQLLQELATAQSGLKTLVKTARVHLA